MSGSILLEVEGLTVAAHVGGAERRIVDELSFTLGRGEILGLVGESGSGKTVACRALMRLLPETLAIEARRVRFDGAEIGGLAEPDFAKLRGRGMGMIFQNPSSHLDPVMRIGAQIAETVRHSKGLSRREADGEAVELLRQVGIPDPKQRAKAYLHEFSGGMRQRAMIAVALASDPKLLIADEPTTALDVTVQAQILRLLQDLRDRRGLSIIFVTHDLGVVSQLCDGIAVLYAGRLCESGPKREVLLAPRHPYSAGLVACQPASSAGLRRLRTIEGQPPSPGAMPPGCRFHPRCPSAAEDCRSAQPPLAAFGPAHDVACFHPAGLSAAAEIRP
ncbi:MULTISPECIES: ABC transporter ATP-binding protein [unclassified Aureimonas]|uniref:ABC transporter ATP-binding protein n=1 Tax=unclassified Aureimonas TaxID=2615206 RepID=UPI0006F50A57|nr:MULTISPECIES: ABC transporter ATP-binding protein [unclassified Aureimonas]KQT69773.1 methionine ABC transporter ATP-binding protein [Aureimonas sp. Leaf427]KQT76075.1 methionine ABC transporter ATP-binding protein [Aureimonas sp. Leaf460]